MMRSSLSRYAQQTRIFYRNLQQRNSICSATNVTNSTVQLTENCVNRIKQLQQQRNTNVVLRVTVDGGGCSGFQYGFELENWDFKPAKEKLQNNDDNLIEQDGAFVLVDNISLAYLSGSKIDYTQELISSSFQISDNPNSESSCGCGVSFTPKQ